MRRRSSKAGLLAAIAACALVASSCQAQPHDGTDAAAPTTQHASVSGPSGPANPAEEQGTSQVNSPQASATTPPGTHPASPAIPTVQPAQPSKLAIPAIGVKADFGQPIVSTHDADGWTITPPESTWNDLQRVYWWKEHALPASPATGTVYVYGHACSAATCAFNRLHELHVGDTVKVTTPAGELTYRIVPIDPKHPHAGVESLAKTAAGIGSSNAYDYKVPGRLVLITCGYAADGSSPFNWVAFAQLVSVRSA